MKVNYLLLITLALTAGCLNSPERVARSTYEIVSGTNRFAASTPKDHKIAKLKWGDMEVTGLESSVNAGAIEAQVQQNAMFMQLLSHYGSLANQRFGGNTPPTVITNFVYVPVSAINTITNR